jgi:hypothetical protein
MRVFEFLLVLVLELPFFSTASTRTRARTIVFCQLPARHQVMPLRVLGRLLEQIVLDKKCEK